MDKGLLINKVKVKLAKKKKDKMPGGLGDGRPDGDFNKEQLEKGITVEVEHTNDKDLAKEVTKDHLTEVPNYYIDENGEDRLKKLEEEAKKELKNKK